MTSTTSALYNILITFSESEYFHEMLFSIKFKILSFRGKVDHLEVGDKFYDILLTWTSQSEYLNIGQKYSVFNIEKWGSSFKFFALSCDFSGLKHRNTLVFYQI